MNELTQNLLLDFKPRLAIVAHAPASDNWRDVYLESHEIDEKGRVLEGRPLKQETIQGIVDVLFDERKSATAISGLLPGNVLKFEILPAGKYNLIWYHPAERRNIYFAESLHIPSGKAWMPPLLYLAKGDEDLSVFALPTGDRPTESTPLLAAPFHNIYADGSVCLGSASVKKPAQKTFDNVIKYWEDLFWLSEFSHLQGSDNPTKSNLSLLWKRLLGDPELTWEQLDELKPTKKRVKDLL